MILAFLKNPTAKEAVCTGNHLWGRNGYCFFLLGMSLGLLSSPIIHFSLEEMLFMPMKNTASTATTAPATALSCSVESQKKLPKAAELQKAALWLCLVFQCIAEETLVLESQGQQTPYNVNILFPEHSSYRAELPSNPFKLPVIFQSNAKNCLLICSSVPYLSDVLPSDDLRPCTT